MNIKNTNKNALYLVLFSVTFVLLAGCGGGFFKGNPNPPNLEYQKGTQGLSFVFLEEAPPRSVFVGNDFSVGMKVKNEGSFDITDGATMEIQVPDDSAFYFSEGEKKPVSLLGRSPYAPEGEESIIYFPVKALCFPGFDGSQASILKNYTAKIKAVACYPYETNANVDVCIDTRKFTRQVGEQLPCEMQQAHTSGGQGAPVAVTSVNPKVVPLKEGVVKLQLDLKIEKVGGDTVRIFHPDEGDDCKALEHENEVALEAIMGTTMLSCEPSLVKLKKSGVTVTCTRDVSTAMGTFTTPVDVNLRYRTQQGMMTTISVSPASDQKINCESLSG